MSRRFGDKRVSFDPSDPEANKLAVSQGYTVVHGGMMSSAAWQNAKAANAILPAGQVTPGPKVWTGEDNPNAALFNDWIPESGVSSRKTIYPSAHRRAPHQNTPWNTLLVPASRPPHRR